MTTHKTVCPFSKAVPVPHSRLLEACPLCAQGQTCGHHNRSRASTTKGRMLSKFSKIGVCGSLAETESTPSSYIRLGHIDGHRVHKKCPDAKSPYVHIPDTICETRMKHDQPQCVGQTWKFRLLLRVQMLDILPL